jgi:IS5 family transposase
MARPRKHGDTGQHDLYRSRLDSVIDMSHPLVKLTQSIGWGFLEERFGEVYADGPGQPPLPTRLMAGLHILKHMRDLSDEGVCEAWLENPYFRVPRSRCVFAGATVSKMGVEASRSRPAGGRLQTTSCCCVLRGAVVSDEEKAALDAVR